MLRTVQSSDAGVRQEHRLDDGSPVGKPSARKTTAAGKP